MNTHDPILNNHSSDVGCAVCRPAAALSRENTPSSPRKQGGAKDRKPLLAVLAAALVLSTGCATSGRYVLLKEYGASVPEQPAQPLKNVTVCLKGFQSAPSLTSPAPASEPEEPPQFTFVPFTAAQAEAWDKEFRALKKNTSKTDWRKIGNLRNMYGMVMSHVYALNDPGAWLVSTLKMDLESQGAKVVK